MDAGVGGKTGVNLAPGKNLFGAFHQPLAALIDPSVLDTLSEREYRAGLYEVLKTGVIRGERLFRLMAERNREILEREPEVVLNIVAQSVGIKAQVVSADENERDLRRILNFGHTLGHALEAETGYSAFLHGEAVAFGMRVATHLALMRGDIGETEGREILDAVAGYGAIPSVEGVDASRLVARLRADKKTVQGTVHFVLPVRIGDVKIVSNADESQVLEATRKTLSELAVQ